jgi:branched-chain amino acid transport system ATP-binding protein
MLDVSSLTVTYGAFLALNRINMRVEKGEIVGVIGPNGAGKTSLARCISGLVRPTAGTITFEGKSLAGIATHRRIDLGISLIPEGRGLFPQMSVDENLLMGGYPLNSPKAVTQCMDDCFNLFPVLKDRRHQLAGTLSGGQQQMLAISMGLMPTPKLCIFDEPSLGLAPIVIQEIGQRLKALRERGLTVLLIEQNARLTCDVADRIYIMSAGVFRYEDTPAKLFQNEEVIETFLSA